MIIEVTQGHEESPPLHPSRVKVVYMSSSTRDESYDIAVVVHVENWHQWCGADGIVLVANVKARHSQVIHIFLRADVVVVVKAGVVTRYLDRYFFVHLHPVHKAKPTPKVIYMLEMLEDFFLENGIESMLPDHFLEGQT